MAKRWMKIVTPLALAFALAGCDSPQDIALKPAIIDQMVQNSVSICQPAAQDTSFTYADRLHAALDAASATDIRTLNDNNVTVCLDQRLDNQDTGFWDTNAQGVLYPGLGKSAIATIWDNGRQPADTGLFHPGAGAHSGYILHAFAGALRDGDVKPGGQRWYAYDNSTADPNGGYYESSAAKPEARFDKDTRAKNPFLQTAPVKAAPAPTAPGAPGA